MYYRDVFTLFDTLHLPLFASLLTPMLLPKRKSHVAVRVLQQLLDSVALPNDVFSYTGIMC